MIKKNNKKAFTLAEMMVVLLVLSIITAAVLPIMTKRARVNTKPPSNLQSTWQYVTSGPGANVDIYYATTNESVIVGKNGFSAGDPAARFMIQTGAYGQNHILFKQGATTTGRLVVDGLQDTGLGKVTLDDTEAGSSGRTVIGTQALCGTFFGTAIGYNAQVSNDGLALGSTAISVGLNTSMAIGYKASSTANYSTAIGGLYMKSSAPYTSYPTTVSANYSTAIGSGAVVSATNSIAIGSRDDVTNTQATAVPSLAIGYGAQAIGTDSIAIGFGDIAKTADTAVGYKALLQNAGAGYNTAIGYHAVFSDNTTTGAYNTGLGGASIAEITTGNYNTAVGYGSYFNITSGNNNTAASREASFNSTSASDGTAIGYQSSYTLTTGNRNTAIGDNALYSNSTAADNTAVGYKACYTATAAGNTCIGSLADTSSGVTYGVAVGYNAKVTGNYGIAIGSGASAASNGVAIGTGATSTGTGVAIGTSATAADNAVAIGASVTAAANTIVFGASTHTVVIPGTLTIGTGGVINTFGGTGTWMDSSDRRLKNIGGESTDGLDKIRELKIYNFTLKKDKEKTPQVGVMAQDLRKIFPNAVIKSEKGHLMIRKDDMFYAMVNSIKQLDKIVQNLAIQLKTVVAKVQTIDDKITVMIKVDQMRSKKIKELETKKKTLEIRLAKLEQRSEK